MNTETERNRTRETIEQWIDSGRITSKVLLNISYHEINRKIAKSELYPTSFRSIVATDVETRNQFESLVTKRLVTDFRGALIVTGKTTLYEINKMWKNGEIIRIDNLGRAAILYII